MTEKVQTSAEETKALKDLAAQYRGRSTSSQQTPSGAISNKSNHELLRTNLGFKGSVNGMGDVQDNTSVVRDHSSLAKDGTIELPNGMIVSEEVAINSGWVRREANGAITLLDPSFNPEAQPKAQQQAPSAQTDEEKEIAKTNEAFAKSDALLDQIESSVSAEGRQAIFQNAEAGDVDMLEKSLGKDNLATLVDGYTRWTENIGKEFGVPGVVDIATETLSDAELKMLRSAVIRGDTHGTRHLLSQALKGLESVDRAEGLLSQLEAEGAKIERKGDGTHRIDLGNGISGSLGSLLRSGHISFA